MAKRRKKTGDGGGGGGEWIVTFSDCMTLLLCFFVMLLSFSSFDEVGYQRVMGHMKTPSKQELSSNQKMPQPSIIKPMQRPQDVTNKGSEVPTSTPPKYVKNPKQYEEVDNQDAYRDRRVFRIPRSDLFWAKGVVVSEAGAKKLKLIVSFLETMSCRVVIAECGGESPERGLLRSSAVMRCMIRQSPGKVVAGLFSVSVGSPDTKGYNDGKPYLEISLLTGKVLR